MQSDAWLPVERLVVFFVRGVSQLSKSPDTSGEKLVLDTLSYLLLRYASYFMYKT